MLLEFMVYR